MALRPTCGFYTIRATACPRWVVEAVPEPRSIGCYWQRLEPPYPSEPLETQAQVYQNAVVLQLEDGGRLVFDRDELAEAVVRPRPRAA